MEKDKLERNVIQPSLKEFSREMLSRLIEISFIELEQAPAKDEPQANGNPQDEKGYTKYESRYLAQKELFSLMLFDPMLEEQISMRKNANFDYMTGLHFFITANKNFHYNFGFFEQQIDFFDQILNGWCSFLDQVVRDVTALQGFITEQCVELEFDGILRLFLCKDTIISASLNLDSFNTIFKKRTGNYHYHFGLYLCEGKKQKTQLMASGQGDGKGKDSGLYKAVNWFNDLVESLKKKYNATLKQN